MKAPRFWDAGLDPKSREAAPLTRALLTPLAMLYARIVERKIVKTMAHRPGIPVICVGNVTTGGTGKTPIVKRVREHLVSKGLRAASLSRGYGGSLKGPLRVDPCVHGASEVGDEPLMLSASGESWIGADRVAAADAMVADGVEAIVMDDGHQNPSLEKTLSLVVIDVAAPFGNGHVIPKGPLREPASRGLARADAIILMGDGTVPIEVNASQRPVLRAKLVPTGPAPDGSLVGFAGVGRPEKVFDSLKAAGANLVDAVPFADHHAFTPRDIAYLQDLAAKHGARLITTEKDYVRLPSETRETVLTFPVHAVFDPSDALDALLAPVLEFTPDAR